MGNNVMSVQIMEGSLLSTQRRVDLFTERYSADLPECWAPGDILEGNDVVRIPWHGEFSGSRFDTLKKFLSLACIGTCSIIVTWESGDSEGYLVDEGEVKLGRLVQRVVPL